MAVDTLSTIIDLFYSAKHAEHMYSVIVSSLFQ